MSTERHSNGGLRAYYFSLTALSWFVYPWLFVLLTALLLWSSTGASSARASQYLEAPEGAGEAIPRVPPAHAHL